ncbi:MAG TPA: MFS transporter [Bryobacteraceae bacterium]|jgi:ACS family hexuronate transporter-like MFS transporter|nr:MFS transporter [Bryobacteraceae bacterium]
MTGSRLRVILGILLCTATLLNYLDRLAIGIVSVEIRHEFSLNESDYARILFFFFLAYSIMYAGSGWLLDKLGTRTGFAVFIAGWSVAQMLHGFAAGFVSLAACRFLLGVTEPGAWPAAAKAVREWIPPGRRALFMGIFNSGSSLGSALAPVVVGWIALAYSWRASFVVTGILGLIWLAAWMMFYRSPAPREAPAALTHDDAAPARPWIQVVRSRGCVTMTLGRFFTDPVIYFIIFWLPEYLRKERGFDLALVRDYAWVPFVVGGAGYVAGGWLSGRLMEAGWTLPRARKFGMACGAAIMPFAIFAPFVPNAALAIAAASCVTLGHALWTANLQTLPADLYREKEVGTVMGCSGSGGAVAGMFAQLGTGWLVMHFSYAPVFVIAGLMHPLAAFLVYRLLPDRYFPAESRHPQVAEAV